jgi:hypothetical protein
LPIAGAKFFLSDTHGRSWQFHYVSLGRPFQAIKRKQTTAFSRFLSHFISTKEQEAVGPEKSL